MLTVDIAYEVSSRLLKITSISTGQDNVLIGTTGDDLSTMIRCTFDGDISGYDTIWAEFDVRVPKTVKKNEYLYPAVQFSDEHSLLIPAYILSNTIRGDLPMQLALENSETGERVVSVNRLSFKVADAIDADHTPFNIIIPRPEPIDASIYTVVIGDGINTTFSIPHNLGTPLIDLFCYANTEFKPDIQVSWERTTDDLASVTFSEPPDIDGYTVCVFVPGMTDDVLSVNGVTGHVTQEEMGMVTQWQATPDNTHFPSEKLVSDTFIEQDSTVVHKTGNMSEDITGAKTFKNGTVFDDTITVNDTSQFNDNVAIGTPSSPPNNIIDSGDIRLDISGNIWQTENGSKAWLRDIEADSLVIETDAVIKQDLNVQGVIKNDIINENEPVTVDDQLKVTGTTTIGSNPGPGLQEHANLIVYGSVSASDGIQTAGNITQATANSTATLKDTSATSLHVTGNTQVDGTLKVPTIDVNTEIINSDSGEPVKISDDLTVTGNTSVSGTLGVTGATTLGTLSAGASTLGVTSVSSLSTAGNISQSAGETTLYTLKISNLQSAKVLVSNGVGQVVESSNIDTTELNALDGINSNIQDQINGKTPINHAVNLTTYGVGTPINYGHVRFDETVHTDRADYAQVATPTTLDGYIGYFVDYNSEKTEVTDLNKESLGIVAGTTAAYVPSGSSTVTISERGIIDFVNSSVEGVAAYYITYNAAGDPFPSVNDLKTASSLYSGGNPRVPTRNDYAIVVSDETRITEYEGYHQFTATSDYVGYYVLVSNSYVMVTSVNKDSLGITAGTTPAYTAPSARYIYTGETGAQYDGNDWQFQYTFNAQYTAAQMAALNSGITNTKVAKLDGIEAGAEVNVQSDWNQATNSADDYIKNKPLAVTSWSAAADLSNKNYPSEKLVKDSLDAKLDDSQLVTSWQSTVSDSNIPSEKLTKDTLDTKQATLVSGTNIKTINSSSILASGNLDLLKPDCSNAAIDVSGGNAGRVGQALLVGSGGIITYGEAGRVDDVVNSAGQSVVTNKIAHLPSGTVQLVNQSITFTSNTDNATNDEYPYRASVSLTGVTSSTYAEVVYDDEQATSLNYAPFVDTGTNIIYLYSRTDVGTVTIPTISIGMDYSGITIDNAPTSGSGNAVSSGGVYTALQGKQKSITISSSAPTSSDGENGDIWIQYDN